MDPQNRKIIIILLLKLNLKLTIPFTVSVKVKLLAKIDIVNRQTQRLLGTLLE